MISTVGLIASILIFPQATSFPSDVLDKRLASVAGRDTVCNVWVFFEKKNNSIVVSPSARAIRRRMKAGILGIRTEDYPVAQNDIASITSLGGSLRRIYKWENAASFSVNCKVLDSIAKLPNVLHVKPVHKMKKKPLPQTIPNFLAKSTPFYGEYGYSLEQLSMVWIPQAHAYMRLKGYWPPGKGVLIGIFDSGFWLTHRCFDLLNRNGSIIAKYDFVDRDTVVSDKYHFSGSYEEHGSCVTAIIGGYDPGKYLGVAWGANFILARTEDASVEDPIEEENWAEALVWAESLGVDIVNSSLGYRYDFDSRDDYPYEYMDGATTIISRAAAKAEEFGIIVVNAMGNEEGMHHPQIPSITAPADVKWVISVGGVTADSAIFFRSSRGPTFDGRIKPDLVAQASFVAVPNLYSDQRSYFFLNGTSFSTPVVSGICALIRQIYYNEPPASIKQRLYDCCKLLPWQDSIDNIAGRGLPNAALACLSKGEILFYIQDLFLGIPIDGTNIYNTNKNLLGVSNSDGVFVLNSSELSIPFYVTVGKDGYETKTVMIDSATSTIPITLKHRYLLVVSIVSASGESLAETASIYRIEDTDTILLQKTIIADKYYTVLPDSGMVRLLIAANMHSQKDSVISINSPTTKIVIELEQYDKPNQAIVKISPYNASNKSRRITNALINVYDELDTLISSASDTARKGIVTFAIPPYKKYRLNIIAKGFISKDTVIVASASVNEIDVFLSAADLADFLLFPTVLRHGRKLSAEFVAKEDKAVDNWQRVIASIRSSDGSLVWTSTVFADEFRPVVFNWDGKNNSGKYVVPGNYYFILQYTTKTAVKKFLVLPKE